MSLRARLFFLFGGLLATLLGAQWWMLRSLSHDLDAEVSAFAVAIGESIINVLESEHRLEKEGGRGERKTTRTVQVKVIPRSSAEELEAEDGPLGKHGVVAGPILHLLHREGGGEVEREVYRLDGAAAEAAASELGLLDRIPLPVESLEHRVRRFTNRMLAGTGALLLLGLMVAGLFAHRTTRPLRRLAEAAGRLGEGEVGVRVEAGGGGEVRETVEAFNRMSDRLQQLEEDAGRLRADLHLRELGEVSRGLAHSLRNPLNALGLSLERLADGDLDPASRHALASTARQQIRRVDGSLRSFLALASSGTVEEEEVDVAALIQDVVLEGLQSSRAAGDRGAGPGTAGAAEAAPPVRLETEVDADLPSLRAVRPELRAVLQALVVNAMEASPPGGRVRLRASRTAGPAAPGLRIEIEDRGPGLPAEVRRQLFSPHVTTKEEGSGMGLYLAQRIAVSRYGGTLRLEDLRPVPDGSGGTRAILELGPRAPRTEGTGR